MISEGRPAIVLMADDDPDDCLLVTEAFKETGMAMDLRCVQDGEELMEYLGRQGLYEDTPCSPRPDLILLDLNMPIKDGREALKEIKSRPDLRSIPIVILTTSEEERDIVESYEMGASSFITKPVDFNDLVELLRVLGTYWFGLVKLPPQKKEC